MKAIVTVETFTQIRERKLDRARKLDRKLPVPTERRISFESAELMLACMTPQRIRLWETAREKARSLTDLADTLKRDRKSIHRDVQLLQSAGLLKLRTELNPGHGRMKLVETTAQRLELRARL